MNVSLAAHAPRLALLGRAAAAIALAASVSFVSGPVRADGPTNGTPPANQPAQPGQPAQPAPTTRGGASGGEAIFNRACGRCHPGGDEDVGPAIRGMAKTEEAMRHIIREGEGRMRPITTRRLPDADLPALFTYLRSIRALQP